MAYCNALFPGTAYGIGHMSTSGEAGQLVKLVGDDQFEVNKTPATKSFGILANRHNATDQMPTVFCNGGIYETDNTTGSITAGAQLGINTDGKIVTAGEGVAVIGEAIICTGGILKFKLTV